MNHLLHKFPVSYNLSLKRLVPQNICLIPAVHWFLYVTQEIRKFRYPVFDRSVWIFLKYVWNIILLIYLQCGPGSSGGIATELRAGRSGIESRCGRDFPPVQTGPGAHPASCKMGTGSFPGVKCGRAVLLTTHPLLVPRSWKSRAIPLHTLWATPGL